MKRLGSILLIATILAASPAHAAIKAETRTKAIVEAFAAIGKDPALAIRNVDPIISDLDKISATPDMVYVCTRDMTDVLTKLIGAAGTGKATSAISNDYCDALFVKGFALIDLNRAPEAEPFLRRATELAPDNAHYLNEYAEWWKGARQWQKSHELFAKAASMTVDQPEKAMVHARALRGMGFTLIELGKLDEAEAQFKASLKFDPESARAKSELDYIAEQRRKTASTPPT